MFIRGRSGYPMGCPNFPHLQNCENYTCPDSMAKCPFSYCIPVHYVRDFIMDCMYGEDEEVGVILTSPTLESCLIDNYRMQRTHVCDGKVECDNFADKSHCFEFCPGGFRCDSGVVIANSSADFHSSARFPAGIRVLKLSGLNLTSSIIPEINFDNMHEIYADHCYITSDTLFEASFKGRMNKRVSRGASPPEYENTLLRLTISFLDIRNTSLIVDLFTTDYFKGVQITLGLYVDHFGLCCPQITGPGVLEQQCHAPDNSLSSCNDLIGDHATLAITWSIALASVIGNAINLGHRLSFKASLFPGPFGVYAINLAIADLAMGVYVLVIAAVDSLHRHVSILTESHWKKSPLCKVAGVLYTLSSLSSSLLLLLILVDKHVSLNRNTVTNAYEKIKAPVWVSAIWLLGMTVACIPAVIDYWPVYSMNKMCLGLPLTTAAGWTYSAVRWASFTSLFRDHPLSDFSFYTHSERQARKTVRAREYQEYILLMAAFNSISWMIVSCVGLAFVLGSRSVNVETYVWLAGHFAPLGSAVNPMVYTVPFIYGKWVQYKIGRTDTAKTGPKATR
ncbi:hypothetical protein Btru_020917 [Bulinus truncatus]|nr:hypothetical protein Btru_020917 [Bulinus truncatus]